jgi:hypothetical protein
MPAVAMEIRMYRAVKKIEFLYKIRKAPITTPEAVYVAFPWQKPDGKIVYEAQGGNVTPGVNNLPGSASDWQTIQNYVSVRDGKSQIILGSDRAPLVMFGDLNLGKWQYQFKADKPYLYSYVMNNYWHTNFPASQEGEVEWSYYMTCTTDTSLTTATRFGWENRVPLVARVLPAGIKKSATSSLSTLRIPAENVLLVATWPAVQAGEIIMLLREIEGEPADFQISSGLAEKLIEKIEEVDVLQESARTISTIRLAPFESKFIRVTMALK